MANQVHRIIEEMPTARLLSVRQHGVIATCMEGRIWVTRDTDRNETVLKAGESFTTTGTNRVLLEALVPSCVALSYPTKVNALTALRSAYVCLLGCIKAPMPEIIAHCGRRGRDVSTALLESHRRYVRRFEA